MHGGRKKKECSGFWAASLLFAFFPFFLRDQPVQVRTEEVMASKWNPNDYWWPLGQWAQLAGNPRSPAQVESCCLQGLGGLAGDGVQLWRPLKECPLLLWGPGGADFILGLFPRDVLRANLLAFLQNV